MRDSRNERWWNPAPQQRSQELIRDGNAKGRTTETGSLFEGEQKRKDVCKDRPQRHEVSLCGDDDRDKTWKKWQL